MLQSIPRDSRAGPPVLAREARGMSDEKPVIVKHQAGVRAASIGMAAIILIAVAIALVAQHPWAR